MDSGAIAEATQFIEAGIGNAADELLTGQWGGDGGWSTKQVWSRVSVPGAGEGQPDYTPPSKNVRSSARGEHHNAGNYEASIPLMQNQMEGTVMDVPGGRKFFTQAARLKLPPRPIPACGHRSLPHYPPECPG